MVAFTVYLKRHALNPRRKFSACSLHESIGGDDTFWRYLIAVVNPPPINDPVIGIQTATGRQVELPSVHMAG